MKLRSRRRCWGTSGVTRRRNDWNTIKYVCSCQDVEDSYESVENPPVSPSRQHDACRVHSQVIALVNKVVWNRVQPCHKLRSHEPPKQPRVVRFRLDRQHRRHKHHQKSDIMDQIWLPNSCSVQSFESRGGSPFQRPIKAVVLVGELVVSGFWCVTNKIFR